VARFDVYANPDADERKLVPYLLDVQNDFLGKMETRVVVPLWATANFGQPLRDLNPELSVEQRAVVMDTAGIGTIPSTELRRAVANLGNQQLDIMNALDTLFGSY
jgi:toxin CcdB